MNTRRRIAPALLAALALAVAALTHAEPAGDPLAKRVTIDLQDARLANVLRMMADETGLNVVVDPAVDRRITLKLGDVTWRQFLDLSLRLYGLEALREGSVVLIAPRDANALRSTEPTKDESPLETRTIRVRYSDGQSLASILRSTVLSRDGSVSVDERTNTLIVRDHPKQLDEAIRLIGHD